MNAPRERSHRVLLVSDNGHGLGHVTRLLAIGRRLPDDCLPVMLTLSEAHAAVRDQGMLVEYFPSGPRLGIAKSKWSALFARRLDNVIERYRPQVVVVDHVAPSAAFVTARRRHPGTWFVWCRRGMWRPGSNGSARGLHEWFDVVLEPGDVARHLDGGSTVVDRERVTEVAPVTLLDQTELLDRAAARTELGLPSAGPAALVALSASDPEDLVAQVAHVRDVLGQVRPGAHLFVPRHPLQGDRLQDVEDVTMRPYYPIARVLRAFDVAVTSAGYNSVHELVRAGVPAVLVPAHAQSVDDQDARAAGAAQRGLARVVDGVGDPQLADALQAAFDGELRGDGGADLHTNGASAAAQLIGDLAAGAPSNLSPAGAELEPTEDQRLDGLGKLVSGRRGVPRSSPIHVIDAVELRPRELKNLVGRVIREQDDRLRPGDARPLPGPAVRPVLLVSSAADTSRLSRRRLAYETVLTAEELARIDPSVSHADHRARRRQEAAVTWGATAVEIVPRDPPSAVRSTAEEPRRVRRWPRWPRRRSGRQA
ncbi:hypothetical protein FTX61_17860 [Nitriliruptoraceae bacterium ZYF776]|nr:hypothetical protein [Profundirhabdus halotolerans]